MDTIVFDGVDYVKASVAAKHFNYTSDYIGQLCRSKKINARLVGRTWFVNIDSIVEHRKNKHAKQKSIKAEALKRKNNEGESIKNKVEIAPVIKSKTLKSIITPDTLVDDNDLERKLRVSYELDEEALLPTIDKKYYKAPTSIRVDHVDATKVKVHGVNSNKSEISYVPNELPDVALSGKLSVEGLAEPEYIEEELNEDMREKTPEDEKTLKDRDIVDTSVKKVVIKPTKYSSIKSTDFIKKTEVFDAKNKEDEVLIEKNSLIKTKLETEKSTKIQFAPKLKKRDVVISPYATEGAVKMPENEPVSSWVLVSPLIATFIAVAVVTLLMSTSIDIEVSDAGYQSNLIIQTANLFAFFAI